MAIVKKCQTLFFLLLIALSYKVFLLGLGSGSNFEEEEEEKNRAFLLFVLCLCVAGGKYKKEEKKDFFIIFSHISGYRFAAAVVGEEENHSVVQVYLYLEKGRRVVMTRARGQRGMWSRRNGATHVVQHGLASKYHIV